MRWGSRNRLCRWHCNPARSPARWMRCGTWSGWNTVWDDINRRSYTSISRNWNLAKFGSFGVWLNDQQYSALLAGLFDQQLARENLAVALANATPQGNLACLITAKDAWVDRTQLPRRQLPRLAALHAERRPVGAGALLCPTGAQPPLVVGSSRSRSAGSRLLRQLGCRRRDVQGDVPLVRATSPAWTMRPITTRRYMTRPAAR